MSMEAVLRGEFDYEIAANVADIGFDAYSIRNQNNEKLYNELGLRYQLGYAVTNANLRCGSASMLAAVALAILRTHETLLRILLPNIQQNGVTYYCAGRPDVDAGEAHIERGGLHLYQNNFHFDPIWILAADLSDPVSLAALMKAAVVGGIEQQLSNAAGELLWLRLGNATANKNRFVELCRGVPHAPDEEFALLCSYIVVPNEGARLLHYYESLGDSGRAYYEERLLLVARIVRRTVRDWQPPAWLLHRFSDF